MGIWLGKVTTVIYTKGKRKILKNIIQTSGVGFCVLENVGTCLYLDQVSRLNYLWPLIVYGIEITKWSTGSFAAQFCAWCRYKYGIKITKWSTGFVRGVSINQCLEETTLTLSVAIFHIGISKGKFQNGVRWEDKKATNVFYEGNHDWNFLQSRHCFLGLQLFRDVNLLKV